MELSKNFYLSAEKLRGKTSSGESMRLIYVITSMKIISDICKEKEYLRISHKLSNVDIRYELLNSKENLLKEISKLGKLKKSIDILLENSLEKLEWDTIRNVIDETAKIDFTKKILRGSYKEITKELIDAYYNMLPPIEKFGTADIIDELLFQILKVKQEETVIDPCIGLGKLALAVGKNSKSISGMDINLCAASFTKLSYAIGNIEGDIEQGDSLADKIEDGDVVVLNYPFNVRREKENIFNEYNKWGEIPFRSSDLGFISMAMLKAKKRGALIVTEGTLFRTGLEGEIRKNILKEKFIEAIISLPGGALENTGIKTNVLIFNKEKKSEEILFIDSESYFSKSRRNLLLDKNNMDELLDLYFEEIEKEGISKRVSLKDILANDGVLNINRYVLPKVESIDVKELEKNIEILKREVNEVRENTDSLLKELFS